MRLLHEFLWHHARELLKCGDERRPRTEAAEGCQRTDGVLGIRRLRSQTLEILDPLFGNVVVVVAVQILREELGEVVAGAVQGVCDIGNLDAGGAVGLLVLHIVAELL